MTVLRGVISAPALFLWGETFGRWQWIPETMPLPERLVAVYFAASDPRLPCGFFRDRGVAQRQRRVLETLLIAAGATRAPLTHSRWALGARW